jgi:hypothetical protein
LKEANELVKRGFLRYESLKKRLYSELETIGVFPKEEDLEEKAFEKADLPNDRLDAFRATERDFLDELDKICDPIDKHSGQFSTAENSIELRTLKDKFAPKIVDSIEPIIELYEEKRNNRVFNNDDLEESSAFEEDSETKALLYKAITEILRERFSGPGAVKSKWSTTFQYKSLVEAFAETLADAVSFEQEPSEQKS